MSEPEMTGNWALQIYREVLAMKKDKALVVVDLQVDFCPGGALGVADGDKIIPTINKYVELFSQHQLPIFVSRDWHPPETTHFQAFGGPWPVHCVQNSRGAQFHPDFQIPDSAIILSKGTDPSLDGYSVFDAQAAENRFFLELLKERQVKELYVAGIATDYCVRTTALDALHHGFKVTVLIDAVKGVSPTDSERTLKEIVEKNGQLKGFDDVVKALN